jgi:hypothetical protein
LAFSWSDNFDVADDEDIMVDEWNEIIDNAQWLNDNMLCQADKSVQGDRGDDINNIDEGDLGDLGDYGDRGDLGGDLGFNGDQVEDRDRSEDGSHDGNAESIQEIY